MKHVGNIVVCFVCELALNAGLRAATAVPPSNPYVPIVVRNVFGLNPPQPVDTSLDTEPPPKITPNGIMTIFGSRQVLFKVSIPAKPGRLAREDSYILGESQRQDDITVTRIDEKSGMVTFNNHGTVQEIPLTVAPAITTPMPASVAANSSPAMPNGYNNAGGFGPFGRNRGNNFNSNGADNGSNLRSMPTRQQVPQIDPATQIIMIEANRQATADQVQRGEMPPLPITELTPPDATGPNGAPLATPP